MNTQEAIEALQRITGKALAPAADGTWDTPEIRQALAEANATGMDPPGRCFCYVNGARVTLDHVTRTQCAREFHSHEWELVQPRPAQSPAVAEAAPPAAVAPEVRERPVPKAKVAITAAKMILRPGISECFEGRPHGCSAKAASAIRQAEFAHKGLI